MPPEIEKHLATIKKTSKTLNALADRATEQIRSLDTFLIESNPGVEVKGRESLLFGKAKNNRQHIVPIHHFLWYRRDENGKWGICVECLAARTDKTGTIIDSFNPEIDSEPTTDFETMWFKRLLSAPRELRLSALPHLSDLIECIANVSENSSKIVEESLCDVEAIANELQSALKKS
jgi:hypothetical protein